jgi:hypothetical protein
MKIGVQNNLLIRFCKADELQFMLQFNLAFAHLKEALKAY